MLMLNFCSIHEVLNYLVVDNRPLFTIIGVLPDNLEVGGKGRPIFQ